MDTALTSNMIIQNFVYLKILKFFIQNTFLFDS